LRIADEQEERPKDWNFPKLHLLQHAFDDIEAKGVTRNYNTKPNEKMHGPLKKAYLLKTNFKDYAKQAGVSSSVTLLFVYLIACTDP
jgi:hypothetical protein